MTRRLLLLLALLLTALPWGAGAATGDPAAYTLAADVTFTMPGDKHYAFHVTLRAARSLRCGAPTVTFLVPKAAGDPAIPTPPTQAHPLCRHGKAATVGISRVDRSDIGVVVALDPVGRGQPRPTLMLTLAGGPGNPVDDDHCLSIGRARHPIACLMAVE